MFGLGQGELILFMFIALLLFGKRLPEVARSMGKGVTEFKKGLRGFEDDVRNEDSSSAPAPKRPNVESDEQVASAPKFQPPTAPPVETQETTHA
ncbi:MAG TPA: twin-arginine translocase TatA/TatE family subunit [Caulifigura sp.]|jgi:sec-independent protein translocase protein TatA|nr:twin-arginine translocase TatA/TatE family subunit [Caulifigura sp.]